MSRFHPLTIADVRQETDDCVSLAFAVPPALAADYVYQPGQHLTLRAWIEGGEVRRSYSISSGLDDGELRVAVKQVPGGRFSTHANERLKVGDVLDVMTPSGRFVCEPAAAKDGRTILCFAAGSGITPVISVIRSVLSREPHSRVLLFYGNRTVASIIFREDLEDIKNQYLDRFSLFHLLSRESQDIALLDGRITAATIATAEGKLFAASKADAAFICGPATMIETVTRALERHGMPAARIHHELFLAPDEDQGGAAAKTTRPARSGHANVTIIRDGVRRSFPVPFDGTAILDAGIAAGVDLPFSCKGGVCSTCRCKASGGDVEMAQNYSLEDWELSAGYVLACQSRPISDQVTLDFDAS